MPEITIWPVLMGVWEGHDKSFLTHLTDVGVKIDTGVLFYVIKGAEKNILIDTGIPDLESIARRHPHRFTRYQDFEAGLKKVGLRPDEIDLVICTHLHWDHCSNNDRCSNARILVQRDEMRYAIAPLQIHAVSYESQAAGMSPPWLRALERTEAVDGDMEVCSGVQVVKIPSHAPGLQGVNVKTSKGNYFVASDFCPLFENWEGNSSLRHIASPIHLSLVDYYDSFAKVEKLADFVLPGHDLKVLEKECYP
jgi:glyoxylase-like metal-dependent hydrolase (beta-lactamase superfamily II)